MKQASLPALLTLLCGVLLNLGCFAADSVLLTNSAGQAMMLAFLVAITSPMYSGSDDAKTHVQQWAEIIGGSFTYWAHTGFKTGLWSPLIVAGPSIAGVIAKEWTKDQVRQYLYENMKVTAERATHYAQMTSTPTFSFENLVKDGILPPEYTASNDPQRLVNVIIDPKMVEILVAGDPGRNQSRAYMSNHVQGPPTSRPIVLPRKWKQFIENQRQ